MVILVPGRYRGLLLTLLLEPEASLSWGLSCAEAEEPDQSAVEPCSSLAGPVAGTASGSGNGTPTLALRLTELDPQPHSAH